jgi:hypothetical protein
MGVCVVICYDFVPLSRNFAQQAADAIGVRVKFISPGDNLDAD